MVILKDKLLKSVEKPARYVGKEINSIIKDKNSVDIRFAFCFPDVYDVGMSHLGMKILYHILNKREDTYCERVFAPWVDMEAKMREENIPLFALESRDEITEFDFVAFTLQYELSYTNILNMLDLAKIPLTHEERMEKASKGEKVPFVIVGGPTAYNCEPIAEFIDIVSLGEGEEHLNLILDKYNEWQDSGKSRLEFLEEIAKIPGTYIPSFYEVYYKEDRTIENIKPKKDSYPSSVKKVVIKDMDNVFYPERFIVPYIAPVHDRAMVELFRGCIRGCRFCQAGMIYRPVREKSVDNILNSAQKIIESTGFDEMSITSLSTSDYNGLGELLEKLHKITQEKGVNLSVPSLRVDSVSKELLKIVQSEKTSSFTFAPEAGTQRMRNVINKNVTEEDIHSAVINAFEERVGNVKLYFMIGLPTETDEDIIGISELGHKVLDDFYSVPKEKRNGRINVTISASSFVPKAFTPFQWESQDSREELIRKQEVIKYSLKTKKISYRWHKVDISFMEGVLARGDRRLSKVIYEAWKNGCKFDSWSEGFELERWMDAFKECDIDPEFYTSRKRGLDEVLPWDHIDVGVSKKFLQKEYEKALAVQSTEHCREKCSACGAASFGGGVCFE